MEKVAETSGDGAVAVGGRVSPWRSAIDKYGIFFALLVMIAVFGALRPDTFLTTENLTNVLVQAAPLAAIAFGLTVVLVMGDFDLSVAAMSSLAGAVAVYLMSKEGVDWVLAIGAALLVAVAVGIANGLLVAYAKNSSFIITLAAGTILTGIEFTITNQETLFENVPQGYIDLGQGSIGGIRTLLIIAAVVFVAILVLLEKTELGRFMRAVGGNSEAARLAGLNVPRLRLIGFVIVAVAAAISGIMLTAQAGSSTPSGSSGLLLPAFAAAFLGAAAFRPGEFNALGTLVGVLILAVIQNGLILMNSTPAVIALVQGGILIAAVWATRTGGQQRAL